MDELEKLTSETSSAALLMGWIHANAIEVPQDRAKAVAYFDRACKGGLLRGCTELVWSRAEGHAGADRAQGVEAMGTLCTTQGYALACWLAGDYESLPPPGLQGNADKALFYYEAACTGGLVTGCTAAINDYESRASLSAPEKAKLSDLKRLACELGKLCDPLNEVSAQ